MSTDLAQLRSAAEEIVIELSQRKDNPIFNYILVVFRDPDIEPAVVTTDPQVMLQKLKEIKLIGNMDCPEMSIGGLKEGIKHALKNSIAFVISDATAKDVSEYRSVYNTMQKKQISATFLLTGDCGERNGEGQSNECDLIINHEQESNAENYVCKAENSKGTAEKQIDIEVKGGPIEKPIEPISKLIGDRKSGPKPDQKSLVIVFDGTNSMKQDLKQLLDAVGKILNDLSKLKINPIFNYILAVFRDPFVDDVFITEDPEKFKEKLMDIKIRGYGDCPEMSLSGLKAGIEKALPNSLIFVITDATAKDHDLFDDVEKRIQNKQHSANFILTDDCDARETQGFKVYNTLARQSNSLVYDIKKNGIEKVLLALQPSMKDTYSSNKMIRKKPSAGKSTTSLYVDSTMSSIDVKLCGEGPKLIIRNPLNQIVTGDVLSMNNLNIVNIKNPMAGKWTVESESSSGYTVQMGSNSELKIKYGFSCGTPKNHGETSVQPLSGKKTTLSFFISDPSKIGYLSNATLLLEKDEEVADKSTRSKRETQIHYIRIKLTKIGPDTYISEAFEAPEGKFKVQLNGVDSNGNDIERLVSTAIESVEPSAPEVSIYTSQYKIERHEKLTLKCIVSSLIPVNIQWFYQNKMIKEMNSNASNECDVIINHEKESNAESYICKAENTAGRDENSIEIEIKGGEVMGPETTTVLSKEAPTHVSTTDVYVPIIRSTITTPLTEIKIEAETETLEEPPKDVTTKASEEPKTESPGNETKTVARSELLENKPKEVPVEETTIEAKIEAIEEPPKNVTTKALEETKTEAPVDETKTEAKSESLENKPTEVPVKETTIKAKIEAIEEPPKDVTTKALEETKTEAPVDETTSGFDTFESTSEKTEASKYNDQVVRASSPEEFLENLDNIEFTGGGDCPEMSLGGLQAGIQYGLPKSIVYVITDATAKDHNKYIETVNFLLTGDCGKRNSDGYFAYKNIARHGNGQVFHIETDGIEKVLMALRITMKDSYTLNQNGRTVLPGTSFMPFSVDSTITDISIRLCGEGPKLTIKNPLNQIVIGDVLTLENLQIVSFKNPMVGKWTIDAESSSEYTIQIESNSKLKFEYGFSSSIPRSRRATSGQPQKGAKNYLTFFVSDPSKIGYLSKATLMPDKTDKAGLNDPVVRASSPEEFLENLDNIEFIRGGDCPEMSLSGLKAGIQYGLPKSIVYVITDATAKDHNKYNETVKKLIRKKSTVNFLLTGDCGKRNSDGYKAYTNIARLSNGQVFHIETDGIEKVLMALRITMKDSYTLNQNGRTVLPGTSFMPFSVDSTITDISIRLCGEGPKLTIKNPLNQIVIGDVLTLENLQIVSFKNPMVGKWTIDAESSSEYTIQIESNSKLKFEYGFSSSIPRNRRATSGQPQKGAKNYLTFFVSDPSKIGYLSKATLMSDKTDKAGRTRREIHIDNEIEFNLIKISDHIYATEPFEAPEGMFKVQLHGVDSNGNDIERLVSTSVEATKPSAPEISIIASDLLDGNITYSCIVNSLIPVLIQWYRQDKLIKEIRARQDITKVLSIN
ncbi:unnamed protein product [Diamesa hyperborea]